MEASSVWHGPASVFAIAMRTPKPQRPTWSTSAAACPRDDTIEMHLEKNLRQEAKEVFMSVCFRSITFLHCTCAFAQHPLQSRVGMPTGPVATNHHGDGNCCQKPMLAPAPLPSIQCIMRQLQSGRSSYIAGWATLCPATRVPALGMRVGCMGFDATVQTEVRWGYHECSTLSNCMHCFHTLLHRCLYSCNHLHNAVQLIRPQASFGHSTVLHLGRGSVAG